ncbi:MAG: adenylate/guanylate cyclase domain-containing response regulator [Comamonadaceae bacterium]|nr:adenylate/guanylate cyclase domain-containing response regulator [Comamonadaceae bacterium]
MTLIVVAEDDPGTLKLLTVVLEKKGHDVVGVSDGATAWKSVQKLRPDVIVSDIDMPGLSGLELLERVRAHPTIALTPFIFLTSLQERRDMRQGMSLGADDYIAKPFRARELAEAVMAQVNKNVMRAQSQDMHVQAALTDALQAQARDLSDAYEERLARALNEQWPGGGAARQASYHEHATVLSAGLLNGGSWCMALSAQEMAQLLKRFYDSCGDTVFLFGAHSLQFVGDGIVAVFADGTDAPASSPHGLRAAKAALALRKAVSGLNNFVQTLALPSGPDNVDLGVALHGGPVAMMRLDGLLGGAAQSVPVGETVMDAVALQKHAQYPGRTGITVSAQALRSITGAVQPVRRYLLALPHRVDPMDVCLVEPLPN